MPWFPDFVSAVELVRTQTRAAGQADPVAQYFAALDKGDSHTLEAVWPGEVVVYDPRAGEIRGHKQLRHYVSDNVAVYERSPDGLLAAARVYDDIEAPTEHLEAPG